MSGRVPPSYPSEVRTEAVHLVREGGVSIKRADATVGCSAQTLRNWILQAGRDDGLAPTDPPIVRENSTSDFTPRDRSVGLRRGIAKLRDAMTRSRGPLWCQEVSTSPSE